jgi:anti-sigma factor RsiW
MMFRHPVKRPYFARARALALRRTRTLAAYLEGTLRSPHKEEMEAEIALSEQARAELAELRQLRASLAAPIAEEDGFDVSAAVHRALDAQLAPPPAFPRRGRGAGYVAVFAACAALALAVFARRDEPLEREFRAKTAHSGGHAERWSGIQIFRVREGESARPLEDWLPRGDGLLFTYRNEGPAPYHYLMIFARDASGEVRWFYPAYEQPGTDPESISIAARSGQTALPDVIRHELVAGQLMLYALFTNHALRVSQVEAWLTAQPLRSVSQRAPEGRLQALAATVVP